MKKNIFKKRAAVSALALGLGLLQGFTYIETGSDPNAAFSDISVYRNTADGNSVTIRTADWNGGSSRARLPERFSLLRSIRH